MKAILVVEMPKSCYKCPMMFDDGNGIWCGAERDKDGDMHMRVHYYCDENGRASWCPLKSMPMEFTVEKLSEEEQDSTKLVTNMATMKVFADGYNACLEEINK